MRLVQTRKPQHPSNWKTSIVALAMASSLLCSHLSIGGASYCCVQEVTNGESYIDASFASWLIRNQDPAFFVLLLPTTGTDVGFDRVILPDFCPAIPLLPKFVQK